MHGQLVVEAVHDKRDFAVEIKGNHYTEGRGVVIRLNVDTEVKALDTKTNTYHPVSLKAGGTETLTVVGGNKIRGLKIGVTGLAVTAAGITINIYVHVE